MIKWYIGKTDHKTNEEGNICTQTQKAKAVKKKIPQFKTNQCLQDITKDTYSVLCIIWIIEVQFGLHRLRRKPVSTHQKKKKKSNEVMIW